MASQRVAVYRDYGSVVEELPLLASGRGERSADHCGVWAASQTEELRVDVTERTSVAREVDDGHIAGIGGLLE